MMENINIRRALGLVMGVIFLGFGTTASGQDALAGPRAQFDQHLERIEAEGRSARRAAILRYSNALVQAAQAYQKEGDLEAVLETRNDIDRFNRVGAIPVYVRELSPDRIRRAHAAVAGDLDEAEESRNASMIKLSERYIAHLEAMKRKLTASNDIQSAMVVRDEIDRVKSSDAVTAAQFEAAASAASMPVLAAGPATAGDAPRRTGKVRAFKFRLSSWGLSSVTDSLRVEKGARFRGTTMTFFGGRILMANSGDTIKEAFGGSNALTVEVLMSSDSLDQSGPARIVGSSLDAYSRNFSLCQEGNKLVLRLRTSMTDKNGSESAIVLGSITARKLHHVIVSYRPGKVTCLFDGRAVTVNALSGNFSNWDAYPLVFGNEYKAERPWKGSLRLVSVENVFLTPAAAAERSQSIKGRPLRNELKKSAPKKRLRGGSRGLGLGGGSQGLRLED